MEILIIGSVSVTMLFVMISYSEIKKVTKKMNIDFKIIEIYINKQDEETTILFLYNSEIGNIKHLSNKPISSFKNSNKIKLYYRFIEGEQVFFESPPLKGPLLTYFIVWIGMLIMVFLSYVSL